MKPTEILATVRAALIKQGRKSHNGRECRYNGPDNTHCGIGWLVPGGLFIEGDRCDVYENLRVLINAGVISKDPSQELVFFLIDVQRCHDSASKNNFVEEVTEYLDLLISEAQRLDGLL